MPFNLHVLGDDHKIFITLVSGELILDVDVMMAEAVERDLRHTKRCEMSILRSLYQW